MSPTWLVTGGGFLATRLIDRLRAHDNDVVNIRRSTAQPLPGVRVVTASLEQLTPETLEAADVGPVDVLAHVAGFIPKQRTEANDAPRAIRDNVQATHALLDALPTPPRRVLFTSTIDLYARPLSGPLVEQSPVGPSDLYGASKLMCEVDVAAWAAKHDIAATTLRVGHLYGPGEAAYQKLIPLTITQLQNGERPVVYGDGSTLIDLLHVDDCAEAIRRVGMTESPVPPVINVVGAPSVSVREVVELLVELSGSDLSVRYEADLPQAPPFSADVTLLDRVAGPWPRISLRDGLGAEIASMAAGA
jgi:nucleoside-diphosphate-sugar epimerase